MSKATKDPQHVAVFAVVHAWLKSSDAPRHVQEAFVDLRFLDRQLGWEEGIAKMQARTIEVLDVAIAKAREGTT